jgi:hypothetical protein
MPPGTKVLQINPDLFSIKKNSGDLSRTLKKEKKQKPTVTTTNSHTLRKNLLNKIRDFQKKEEQNAKEVSKLPTLDQVKEFDGEFNKSLQFLEELANKHKTSVKAKKEKKREIQQLNQTGVNQNGGQPIVVVDGQQQQLQHGAHNKTIRKQNREKRPMINTELPEELKFDANFYYGGNNQSQVISNGIQDSNTIQIQQPQQIMQQPQLQQVTAIPLPIIQAPIIQNQVIETQGNNSMQVVQSTPVININTESVPQEITHNQAITSTSISPSQHMTLKQPPPYSNLKSGGNKPTYKEWMRTTQKVHHTTSFNTGNHEKDGREKHLEQLKEKYANKSSKNRIKKKRLIQVKTKTIKYNLGKKGKTVSVLIKNNMTRKKVNDEFAQLKIKPINEVKDFLKSKNLIKAGTTAPTDVLRTMYEQTILTGDLTNESKDNLIHNFMSK